MVLPLIPVALIGAGAISGAAGAVNAVRGALDMRNASNRIEEAGKQYTAERVKLEEKEVATNEALVILGAAQANANSLVVERMVRFLRRNRKLVAESEKLLIDGLDSATKEVELGSGLDLDAVSFLQAVIGSAVTGVGVNVGVTTAVTALASASTGTAISALSGAAASNATLAFLGGGALSAGGGGMAVGAAALSAVALGPALLVGSFFISGQGDKAKVQADEQEAAINVAIAEMGPTAALFDAIIARSQELGELLGQLVTRAVAALDLLESEQFDPTKHAVPFQNALTLTVAVRDVASTPVLDDDGDINEDTATLKVRYRTLTSDDGE